jgi:uncharacterized protein YejL (UPF0352 family)
MFEWFNLFPPYLVFLTLLLVIFPTVIAIGIRITIYNYLNGSLQKIKRLIDGTSRGEQPKIVEILEHRFRNSSQKLEEINTVALIDGIYAQETFKFWGYTLNCERWDYFCKVLPNLLLAFGLLGTFLGITINLYELSQTINYTDTDITGLISKLKTPLQSMGIAFVTSLIALICSSSLTICNLRFNTTLSKKIAIDYLEDYLDNIYKTQVQGDTRLDKAVDRMVRQQEEFLKRFHEKVGEVLETTLGSATNKMVAANQNFHNNVDRLVDRFQDISGTIDRGANTFQDCTSRVDVQLQVVPTIISSLQELGLKLEQGSKIFQDASASIERSKFSEKLEQLTENLTTTQKAFSQSTAFLGNQVYQIVEGNNRANNLAEQVYTKFEEAAQKIYNSTNNFSEAAQAIENSQFANTLVLATSDIIKMQDNFNLSATSLNNSSDNLALAIKEIQACVAPVNSLSEEIKQLYLQSIDILNESQQNTANQKNNLQQIEQELNDLVENLKQHQAKVNQGLLNFGERILTNFQQQATASNQNLENIDRQLSQYSNNLINSTESLQLAIQEIKDSTQQIDLLSEEIKKIFLQSIKFVDLRERSLVSDRDSYQKIEKELNRIVETLKKHQQKVNESLMNLAERLLNNFEKQATTNNQKLEKISNEFAQYLNYLNRKQP